MHLPAASQPSGRYVGPSAQVRGSGWRTVERALVDTIMKAIRVSHTGGPEVMEVVDAPVTQPKVAEALVKVNVAGVNSIDRQFRDGSLRTVLPFIPGKEGAGVVTAVGAQAKAVRAGDRVAWSGTLGSYAEYVAGVEEHLVPVPASISDSQAAAAMVHGLTAHYLVNDAHKLKVGETALVHSAAGGVGLLLVQMARAVWARVIGVGRATFEKNLNVMRLRGMLVIYGMSSGPVPPVDPAKLSEKGSLYMARTTLAHFTATREELLARTSALFGLIATGKLKVRIAKEYPLADAAQAHRDMEARKVAGKLLLIP